MRVARVQSRCTCRQLPLSLWVFWYTSRNEQVFEREERVGVKVQPVELGNGQRTTTVLGDDHLPLQPAEEDLGYLRAHARSPNTVKSYAPAIALSFEYQSLCADICAAVVDRHVRG